MKAECPNCGHRFQVELEIVNPRPSEDQLFRRSVAAIRRDEQFRERQRTIQPSRIDPDRPVSK